MESIAAKKITLLHAAETHGVQRIVDRLTVTPAEDMGDAEIRDHVCRVLLEEPSFERCLITGSTANDDELTDAVGLVLEKDPFVNASSIRASTKDWIVTLEGLVPTEAMKEMAERDAWYVLGVKSVSNKITVER